MSQTDLTTHEYAELVALLERRLAVIADTQLRDTDPDAQFAQLKNVSEAISGFHILHQGQLRPRLNHFLENSSLEKALEFAKAALEKV